MRDRSILAGTTVWWFQRNANCLFTKVPAVVKNFNEKTVGILCPGGILRYVKPETIEIRIEPTE